MKIKTLLAALVLAVAPTISLAMATGCSSGHSEASMSCATGTIWDAETRTCVPNSTS